MTSLRLSRERLAPVVGLAFGAAAIAVLHHELGAVDTRDVTDAIHATRSAKVGVAVLLAALAYAAMALRDVIGARHAGIGLSAGRIVPVSLLGDALDMNLGWSAATGGAVRARYYALAEVDAAASTRASVFGTLGSLLGFAAALGLLLLGASELHSGFGILAAVALLATLAAAVVAARRGGITSGDLSIPFPAPKVLAVLAVVAVAEWVLAGTALYALMPEATGLSWPRVLQLFLVARMLGIASQSPGGLGVFEAAFMAMLADSVPRESAMAALVLHRIAYFVLPLVTVMLATCVREATRRREQLASAASRAKRIGNALVPPVLSVGLGAAGFALLLSSARPVAEARRSLVGDLLPLPFIEASHFLASIVGLLLLVVAQAAWRRVAAAWAIALGLLGLGVFFSLAKGFGWEEALLLVAVMACVGASRERFTREARLMRVGRSAGTWALLLAAVGSFAAIGLFSFKRVEFTDELWWRFAADGDASRFLRAGIGVMIAMGAIAVQRLLSPSPPVQGEALAPEQALPVIRGGQTANAWLALLGDKRFFRSASGKSFIMFGSHGRCRIALGDPVGPEEEWPELLWEFRDACERDGAIAVFYQVSQAKLHLYVEMGMALFKMGEEGRVPLTGFSMNGSHRSKLRQSRSFVTREGGTFEVLPAPVSPEVIEELRAVSDNWLASKGAAEKSFSLGSFLPDYLAHCPIAVVRKEGRIIAFANLWLSGQNEELSPDLMRYHSDSPRGIIEFLFVEAMLWGAANGYRYFSLGMAPLSGLSERAKAPAWDRVGTFIFEHGEQFYNFEGLRAFKEKFAPEWRARYLAVPGWVDAPRALLDSSALIAGGVRRIVRR